MNWPQKYVPPSPRGLQRVLLLHQIQNFSTWQQVFPLVIIMRYVENNKDNLHKKFFCEGVWQNKLRNHLFKPFIANMVAPENNAMLRQKVCHQSRSYSNLSISKKLKIDLVPTQLRIYKTSFYGKGSNKLCFVWLETFWLDNVCFCQKDCYINLLFNLCATSQRLLGKFSVSAFIIQF